MIAAAAEGTALAESRPGVLDPREERTSWTAIASMPGRGAGSVWDWDRRGSRAVQFGGAARCRGEEEQEEAAARAVFEEECPLHAGREAEMLQEAALRFPCERIAVAAPKSGATRISTAA
jgi:hypothetical protein